MNNSLLINYIDLTKNFDLSGVVIKQSSFECLLEKSGHVYKGFILAKSEKGEAYTICDVNFRWSNTDRKYATRLIFRRTNKQLQDKKVKSDSFFQRIPFNAGEDGYREFWKMLGFLGTFNKLVDVGDFHQEFRTVSENDLVIHITDKSESERIPAILEPAQKAGIDADDIRNGVTQKERQTDIEVFEKLLVNQDSYRDIYRSENNITKKGDEATWHHFLKNHKWIFGLSLDLRFIEDILDEQSIGNPSSDNKGNPMVDMMGISDYTVLIELKTPETDIFTRKKTTKARANTWSFTDDFIEGFSQCLAQKSDWNKNSENKRLVHTTDEGKRTIIDQGIIRTIDPQGIFIVGNKDRELPRESRDDDTWIKRDTLERFIKNNRNINIISYDELFRRAYYIAHHRQYEGKVVGGSKTTEDVWEIPF